MLFYERFLFVSGQVTWNGAMAVRLRGPLDEDTIRDALARLQRRHPALRMGIEFRGGRPWFATADAPPPILLETVVRHDDDTWLEAAWRGQMRPFELPAGPLVRVLWIRPAAQADAPCELVIEAHHCICDGASMVLLMRELLRLLGDPRMELEPLAELPVAKLLAAGGQRRMRDRAMVVAARTLLPLASLLPVRARGADYYVRWELDAALTAGLDRRCRTERTTITMVLAAAALRAFRSVRGRAARNRLLCPIDTRTLLPVIGRERLFAVAEAVMLSLGEPGEAGFWEQTRRLRERLVAQRDRLDPGRRIALAEGLHGCADALIRLQMHGRVKQDAALSVLTSLNLPEGHGPTTLEAVLGTVAIIPWREATALLAMRDRGRMRMMLVSREDLLPRDAAEQVRDAMLACLQEAGA
jgi:hypothetical protein